MIEFSCQILQLLWMQDMNRKPPTSSKEHHIRLQMLQVENEIQQFKKEVDYERQKLHLIAKLTTLGKSKLANRSNAKICSPPAMPVTHVVTQLKTNVREDCIGNTETYHSTNNKDIPANHTIIIQSAPLEVLSYKNVLPEIECPSYSSSFCPHKKMGGGGAVIREITNGYSEDRVVEAQENSAEKFKAIEIVCESVVGGFDCEETWLYEEAEKESKKFPNLEEEQQEEKEIGERSFDSKRVHNILRKYWDKWVVLAKRNNSKQVKMKTGCLNKSERNLNRFLKKLEERKKVISRSLSIESDESSERTSSSSDKSRESSVGSQSQVFTNRLEAQKSIIKEQQSKIEMQNKLIEQLKFEKIQQEIKASESNLRLNVIETLNNCEQKIKPAAKCLKAVISDINRGFDEKKNAKFDFVTRMNDRAEHRKERWNVIREKRKMQEEEAEREKLAEEEKRKNEEEERRRKILQEKKEKAEMKKEQERKKQVEIAEFHRKCAMADDFYAAKLMNKVFKVLSKNVSLVEDSLVEAKRHFNMKMVKKCFDAWKNHSFFTLTHKLLLAEAFCHYNTLQRCWDQWIMCHKESVKNQQVAEDFFDSKVQERVLRRWKMFRKQEQITLKEKAEIASNYHNRKLLKKCLDNWRKFPKLMYKEREKEQRIRQWHDKVQEILPDFSPVLLDDS
ncbi:coiled-coil domain-containing protein 191 isoform X2 [Nilaparvata lugens]|uniref:coiled-coil domain-containing protein 191 isoform X2 n=1 Tax=Nilaparvata lugens TaxID=108931 RepID=UPI00193C8B7A|nr:coiled-coil domain-containing protein 191 isoform X2 [Nilaparvata lugens]